MRIAIVATNEQVVGGAETYLRWLLSALSASGHDLAFGFQYAALDPIRKVDSGTAVATRWHLLGATPSAVVDMISGFAPDIVYHHGLTEPALERALMSSFSTVLFAHAYWGTCLTGNRAHAAPRRAVCSRRFGRACVPLNFVLGCGARNPATTFRLYNIQRARQESIDLPAALIVASEHMRRVYEHHGVDPRKIHVIPYPSVDVSPLPEAPPPRPRTDRVLYLGRLTTVKGIFHAIRATNVASQLLGRRLRLTIAGDGPALERVRRTAKQLDADIEVLGWIDGARRIDLLRACDALIVPSLWPEPFGIVGLEAACVGVPAVAYAVGGIPDWLVSGVTGEMATAFEPDSLGGALARALSSSDHLNRLRVGAWKRAHTFSADRHLKSLEEVLTQAARH